MESSVRDAVGTAGGGLVCEARIAAFVGHGSDYYKREFERLGSASGYVASFNPAAAVLGPFWLATRQLWGWFWPFLVLETLAIVQLCRGLFADLGADEFARALRLSDSAVSRRAEAEEALASGAGNAGALVESALALEAAGREAYRAAEAAAATAPALVLLGVLLLAFAKGAQGLIANHLLSRRYFRWCSDRSLRARLNVSSAAGIGLFLVAVYGFSAYRFSSGDVPRWLEVFPASRRGGAAWSPRSTGRSSG